MNDKAEAQLEAFVHKHPGWRLAEGISGPLAECVTEDKVSCPGCICCGVRAVIVWIPVFGHWEGCLLDSKYAFPSFFRVGGQSPEEVLQSLVLEMQASISKMMKETQ